MKKNCEILIVKGSWLNLYLSLSWLLIDYIVPRPI